jgi:hypothetical protein
MGMFKGMLKRQLIIKFLSGVGDDVINASTSGLEYLAGKRKIPSETVTFPTRSRGKGPIGEACRGRLKAAMKDLPAGASRVYLDGHWDWTMQTIGGWPAGEVADLLGDCGLPDQCVVSVLGCELARDRGSPGCGLLGVSVDSFASNLHRLLWDTHALEACGFARVQQTYYPGTGKRRGHKGVLPVAGGQKVKHHLERSKVLYTRHEGEQVRLWFNYATNGLDLIDAGHDH